MLGGVRLLSLRLNENNPTLDERVGLFFRAPRLSRSGVYSIGRSSSIMMPNSLATA